MESEAGLVGGHVDHPPRGHGGGCLDGPQQREGSWRQIPRFPEPSQVHVSALSPAHTRRLSGERDGTSTKIHTTRRSTRVSQTSPTRPASCRTSDGRHLALFAGWMTPPEMIVIGVPCFCELPLGTWGSVFTLFLISRFSQLRVP